MERMRSSRRWVSLAAVGGALFCFGPGWVVASVPFATQINQGLVQALNSVGQNLFGSAVFGARAHPPDPVYPIGGVKLDLATDSRIPAVLGVFHPSMFPNDPCYPVAQIQVMGDGMYRVVVDPAADDMVEFDASMLHPPNPSVCKMEAF